MVTEGFLPVQSFDLDKGGQINFDLFLFLPNNNKYILYRKKGTQLERSQMQKLVDHNVENFFIRKEDYNQFVKYVALRIGEIIQSADPALAASTAKSLLSTTFNSKDPAMVQALMNNLYEITSTIIETVLESSQFGSKRIFRRLGELVGNGDSQRHPVNVSSLSVLLTFGIGYQSESTLYNMAVAGLLHDIGLSKISPKVAAYADQWQNLNTEEQKELFQHPLLSLEIIKSRGLTFPSAVGSIILQHHEQFNGKGYPQHLQGFQISEFSQILFMADALDEQIQSSSSETLKEKIQLLFRNYYQQEVINPVLLKRIERVIF